MKKVNKKYNDKMNKLSKQIEKNAEFFQAKCMREGKYVESLKWMGIKQDQKERQKGEQVMPKMELEETKENMIYFTKQWLGISSWMNYLDELKELWVRDLYLNVKETLNNKEAEIESLKKEIEDLKKENK